jgi:hypothetical protein
MHWLADDPAIKAAFSRAYRKCLPRAPLVIAASYHGIHELETSFVESAAGGSLRPDRTASIDRRLLGR